MNSLHESIARRRAAEIRNDQPNAVPLPERFACMTLGARPGIVLAPWQAESWIFPWSHLQWARLASAETAHELVLVFPHHEVAIKGERLHGLVDPAAEFRIAALRSLPDGYGARLAEAAPVVASIDVREIDPK